MRSSRRKKLVISQKRHRNCSPAVKNNRLPRHRAAPPGAVGIVGGIFDPVHNGHLAIAARARDYFGLSKILFIPSGRPPHKSQVTASEADRFAMLCLAVRDEPAFAVWDGELRRKGVSFTFDTLRELKEESVYFIVGSDNLQEIETWRRWRDVLAMVTLCVAHRPGYSIQISPSLKVGRIEKFPSPELDISSSMIREKIAAGHPYRHLVPQAVAEYISKRKLYE